MWNKRKYVTLSLMAVGYSMAGCHSQKSLRISEPEQIYSEQTLPIYLVDITMTPLPLKNGEYQFYHCGDWSRQNFRYSGPPSDPFETLDWKKTDPEAAFWNLNGWYSDWFWVYPWIPNIYKISDKELLAFCHVEKMACGPSIGNGCDHYALGIGYSSDAGESWTYCGEILKPQNDYGNVGGVPYIVNGDWFYVYFNEQTWENSRRTGVARAKVKDVITAARKFSIVPWKKYADGQWNQDALTGLGTNILPPNTLGENNSSIGYDMHADAAYCSALKKYMLTAQTGNYGKLLLFTSSDGVHWESPLIVEDTGQNTFWHCYSFFFGLKHASDDSHIVGSEFYLYYPRKAYNNYIIDDFYRRKITVIDTPNP